jgi:hypothetical protein
MSINHYTNPNLNFNVKSLKINGQDFLSSSTNFMKFTGSMNTSDTTYLHPTDTHSIGSTQFVYEYTRLIRKQIRLKEVLIQRSNSGNNGFINVVIGNENYGNGQLLSSHTILTGQTYAKIILPNPLLINADSTIAISNFTYASGVMMVILIFEYV